MNVGVAVLSDVGELDNIHPGDKRTVGTRLAALALNRLYGFTYVKCDAPEPDSAKLSEDGKKVAYMRKLCVHGTLKNEAGLPLGPFRHDL